MFYVNGIGYPLSKNLASQVLIDVITQLGYDIPRFCYHENLKIAGNCRMCLIEDSKAPKPTLCCASNPVDNLSIFTNTALTKKSREAVMEFLLINHPLDRPICDQGGECDSQDLSLIYGSDHGRFYDYKRNVEDKNCGFVVKTIMNRCILCTRCVRFAGDVAGVSSFGLTGRGGKMEIGSYIEQIIHSELSGNLVDVCPVGALTLKPYSFVSRPWELKKTTFINIWDDVPQLLRADIKENEIVRIMPIKDSNLHNLWVTNRTRFSYEGLQRNRLLSPTFDGVDLAWEFFLNSFQQLLFSTHLHTINISRCVPLLQVLIDYTQFIGHSEFILLKQLVTKLGSILKSTQQWFYNDKFIFLPRANAKELINFDSYLLMGLNVEYDLPILTTVLQHKMQDSALTSYIVSWNSTLPVLLKPYQLNIGSESATLFNFLSCKSWISTFLWAKISLAAMYSYSLHPLMENFRSAITFLITLYPLLNTTMRNFIEVGLSTTSGPVTGACFQLNRTNKENVLFSITTATHKNFGISDIALPIASPFEVSLGNYCSQFIFSETRPILSKIGQSKSFQSVLVVLMSLLFVPVQSVYAVLSGVLQPYLTKLHYFVSYSFQFTLQRTSSQKEYYALNSLFENSPTLAGATLTAPITSIY